MANSDVDKILDLRGLVEPITLLKVTQAFREMASDEILEILVRDESTKKNLFKVLHSSSFDLILMEKVKTNYRIQIKKR